MTFAFLYPFILGTILTIIVKKSKITFSNFSLSLYNSGVLTLTIGSFIKGIFIIAGTSSKYQIIYTILGTMLILLSIISIIKQIKKT